MSWARQDRGAKFVSGDTAPVGLVVLTREDGSSSPQRVALFRGELVDNGDGTTTLIAED